MVRAGCSWKNSQAVPFYAEEIVMHWHTSTQSISSSPPTIFLPQKNTELTPEKVSSASTVSVWQTSLVCTAHALWFSLHSCAAGLDVIKSPKGPWKKCVAISWCEQEIIENWRNEASWKIMKPLKTGDNPSKGNGKLQFLVPSPSSPIPSWLLL